MQMFDELFQRLNEQDESVEIEAKTARQIGTSVLETICAFANEPNRGGGYILLGVARLENDSPFPEYEIRNPGHSLIPDDRLGEPDSITRNEKIAAVLHETRYAETKGSGIRSMLQAMAQAGLSLPTFESDREKNVFVVTFLFHHFLNADDVEWLGSFSKFNLSEDEQKALVYARERGAINNAAFRDINRVDTLAASSRLRHLRDLGLLEQKGKSDNTYYKPTAATLNPEGLSLKHAPYHQSLPPELTPNHRSLSPIPASSSNNT